MIRNLTNTEDIKGGGFPLRFQGLVKSGKYNPDKDRQWRSSQSLLEKNTQRSQSTLVEEDLC